MATIRLRGGHGDGRRISYDFQDSTRLDGIRFPFYDRYAQFDSALYRFSDIVDNGDLVFDKETE